MGLRKLTQRRVDWGGRIIRPCGPHPFGAVHGALKPATAHGSTVTPRIFGGNIQSALASVRTKATAAVEMSLRLRVVPQPCLTVALGTWRTPLAIGSRRRVQIRNRSGMRLRIRGCLSGHRGVVTVGFTTSRSNCAPRCRDSFPPTTSLLALEIDAATEGFFVEHASAATVAPWILCLRCFL